MGKYGTVGWAAVGLFIFISFYDTFRLFQPDLTPTGSPTEVIYTPSWSPPGNGEYVWRACISESETEIHLGRLTQDCIFEQRQIRLDGETNVQANATVPSKYLLPFVQRQEEYTALHEEYVLVSHELSSARAARASAATIPKDPDAIGSTVSTLSALSMRQDALKEKLAKMKKLLRSKELHLHSFFYKLTAETKSNPFADPHVVHSSAPLLARWIVQRNNTRNLLSAAPVEHSEGETHQKVTNAGILATTVASSTTPSIKSLAPKHLQYHFRPIHSFQFVSEPLSFPASKIPGDLLGFFPRGKEQVKRMGKKYTPMIQDQDFLVLRKAWVRLENSSFLAAVGEEEKNWEKTKAELEASAQPAGTDASHSHHAESTTDGEEEAYTTTPAKQAGVSDAVPTESEAVQFLRNGGFSLKLSLKASSLGWMRLLSQFGQSGDLFSIIQEGVDGLNVPGLEGTGSSTDALSLAKSREAQLHQSLVTHSGLQEDKDNDIEDMKTLLFESNPTLLLITFAISLLHLIFDFLAVKNDIQFWRAKRNNFIGISAKSIWIQTGVRTIIFAYLIDQDTSRLVLFSAGLSLAVMYWKSIKILRISLEFSSTFPYILKFGELPKSESKTNEYDARAMRFLGWVSLPFIIGGSIYSLVYQQHKSYYSWILASCASAVYVGGFILMCPQLYVNYRLKSVAHLPVRVFVYRLCNTFIDDLFAYLLSMPTAHKIATLRDDVIFIAYLYQRWIYPVDASRTIQLDEDDGEPTEEKKPKIEGTPLLESAAAHEALPTNPPESVELSSQTAVTEPPAVAPEAAELAAAPALAVEDAEIIDPPAADESTLTRRRQAQNPE